MIYWINFCEIHWYLKPKCSDSSNLRISISCYISTLRILRLHPQSFTEQTAKLQSMQKTPKHLRPVGVVLNKLIKKIFKKLGDVVNIQYKKLFKIAITSISTLKLLDSQFKMLGFYFERIFYDFDTSLVILTAAQLVSC